MVRINVEKLDSELPLPSFAHVGDAGLDLYSRLSVELKPQGGRCLIPTGIAIELPKGFAGFVIPRSGLALRNGVTTLNAPGLIDSGYRGEICVLLVNLDPSAPYTVRRGDRIAQLVICKVEEPALEVVSSLSSSTRASSGFGGSGR